MLHAPVAFFIFNRPETTEQVFAEIARAKPSRFLIVADGPRLNRSGETEKCTAARAIVQRVDWDCEVLTNFAEANLGPKRRVASGLDWVFENVEEAIILEDDCVPNASFFSFCEEMLSRYRHDNRVMMISGSNFLADDRARGGTSYFFSRCFLIWGWATWRRAWRSYDVEIREWRSSIGITDLAALLPCRHGTLAERILSRKSLRHMANMFDLVQTGRLDTWDYQWVFNCLFNGGLAVVPRSNLVQNVGVEGAHTPDRNALHFIPTKELQPKLAHPHYVRVDPEHDWAMYGQLYAGGALGASPLVPLAINALTEIRWLRWLYGPARTIYRAVKKVGG